MPDVAGERSAARAAEGGDYLNADEWYFFKKKACESGGFLKKKEEPKRRLLCQRKPF